MKTVVGDWEEDAKSATQLEDALQDFAIRHFMVTMWNQRFAMVAGMLVTTVGVWMLYAKATAVGWFVLNAAWIIAELLASRKFMALDRATQNKGRTFWGVLSTCLSAVYGLMFGGLCLLVLPSQPLAVQVALSILVTGVCSYVFAITFASGTLASHVIVRLPMLAITGAWLLRDDPYRYLLCGSFLQMTLLYEVNVAQQRSMRLRSFDLTYKNKRQAELLLIKNEQLEQNNKDKLRLLATASHDLRQPVHALGMLLESWRHQPNAAAHGKQLGAALSSVRYMEEALGSLMDLSRVANGAYEAKWRAVDIDVLLNEVAAGFAPSVANKGLELGVHCPRIRMVSEPTLLSRVIWNLLSNAVKFTEHGSITVECVAEGERVVIKVQDTGMGIPLEQQAKVFREFHRDPKVSNIEGAGLGLSVVKRLITFLGGAIEVDSAAGAGCTFTLRLPLRPPDLKWEPRQEELDTQDFDISKAAVLLVEDNDAAREGTAASLESWGCQVLAVATVEEARQRLASEGFRATVIISDFQLSGVINGLQCIALLRAQLEDPLLPALLMTGDVGSNFTAEAEAMRVKVLYKPVRPKRLRDAVAETLGLDPPPDSDFMSEIAFDL